MAKSDLTPFLPSSKLRTFPGPLHPARCHCLSELKGRGHDVTFLGLVHKGREDFFLKELNHAGIPFHSLGYWPQSKTDDQTLGVKAEFSECSRFLAYMEGDVATWIGLDKFLANQTRLWNEYVRLGDALYVEPFVLRGKLESILREKRVKLPVMPRGYIQYDGSAAIITGGPGFDFPVPLPPTAFYTGPLLSRFAQEMSRPLAAWLASNVKRVRLS
ncbi:hypothetical protein KFL_004910040 [Klebsormidium nitens]|uniref:Uncharacterized protein n=1 Tax=Klebsormidium nitens TaxID=105231 RepID=A0A1Y1IK60_KLENI|nr:hypothetical protein KFL_004910040 [Klebsormidium nitens]|eukprot:GAQ89146.1 hypothetical protein KFL_004910040 [Klebsormidium nitens]